MRDGLRRYWGLLFVALFAALISAQIFWPPIVGIANNGDFSKIAAHYDVEAEGGPQSEYVYFVSRYRISPAVHWNSGIISSENVFAAAATSLGRRFISNASFDIRAVGVLHLIVLLAVSAGFVAVLRRTHTLRAVLLAAVALFIFTDVAYTAYLNSFYMDAAATIFLLASVVAAVACDLDQGSKSLAPACLVVSAVLLITAKTQHAILGIPLALFAAAQAVQTQRGKRIAWCAIAGMCVASMAYMLRYAAPSYKAYPIFSAVFYNIANQDSPRAAADLEELGLGAEYLPYRGMYAYSPGAPLELPGWQQHFLDRTGYGAIARFYARHPRRAVAVIWRDIQEFGPDYPDPTLANYRQEDGFAPRSRSRSFSAWHALRNRAARDFPLHIPLMLAGSLIFSAACCFSKPLRLAAPGWMAFFLVTLMALLALVTATLADGVETARHLYLFQVLLDIICVFIIAGAATRRPQRRAAAA